MDQSASSFRLIDRLIPAFPSLRLLLSTGLLLVLGSLTYAQSSMHRVPQQHRTIQRAIDASQKGDTVLVDHGIYYENVVVAKNIVLASKFILDRDTSHISRTILDGSKAKNLMKGSVVTIMGNADTTCAVQGFTIRGGTGSYLVYLQNAEPEPNVAGGGILIVNSGAYIANNVIVDNTIATGSKAYYAWGGGIGTFDTAANRGISPILIIEDNIVARNTCIGEWANGGGIAIDQPSRVRRNVVVSNKAVARLRAPGGGIAAFLSGPYDIFIEGNYVHSNSAGIAGGILVAASKSGVGRVTVTNNIIVGNEASEIAGGINVAERSFAVIVNNTITANRTPAYGGGILVPYEAITILVNNIIWNNSGEQVTSWANARAYNNAIQGGFAGPNIDMDPRFEPGDSLYRLSAESPCINTGIIRFRVAGVDYSAPHKDFLARQRARLGGGTPDLGATESPYATSPSSEAFLNQWRHDSERSLKLAFNIRQVSSSDYSEDGRQLIHAGRMTGQIIRDDSISYEAPAASDDLSFTLPPGNNTLEVEVAAHGRQENRRLFGTYRLEGLDAAFNVLHNYQSHAYSRYSNLEPGTYRLVVSISDENNFIDYSNRKFVSIEILPYWWQTWWAYLTYLCAALGAGFGLAFVRIRRIRLVDKAEMEHLRADELAKTDRMKSQFLANVSHELRTPLTLIKGPLESVLAKVKDQNIRDELGMIARNAHKLHRLIEQLLQFSRVESKTIRLRVCKQEVIGPVRRIVGYFSSAAAHKGVQLTFTANPRTLPGYVDGEKLEHVVENLISNAIKFTPAGGRVDTSIGATDDQLEIIVVDSGNGISEHDLPHVFDRFYRGEHAQMTEGTGIGLALTKELVEIHHGTINVDSAVGNGTTFTVRVPLSGYSDSEIVNTPSTSSQPVSVPEPNREQQTKLDAIGDIEKHLVLIAEDNEDARIFIASTISRTYRVESAEDGRVALQKCRSMIPDLVISDVMMPTLDGYELCQELKQDERTSHIPVILLTALAGRNDKLEGLEIGADDYLVKPFDSEELLIRVRNLIEGRRKIWEKFRTEGKISSDEQTGVSMDQKFLERACQVVDNNMSQEHFESDDFAHEMFLSRTQLHRKLKAITGYSTMEFVRHQKLRKAKSLLEAKTGTVSEIADQTGFPSHSYFAKLFREAFGISPSEVGRVEDRE